MCHSRFAWSIRLAAGLLAMLLPSCGSSSSPSAPDTPSPIATYIVRAVALDNAEGAGVNRSGSPPAPAGGPTVTVQSSPEAVAGSPNLVKLESATPFEVVYLSVAAGSAQTGDHLQITLSEPVTNVSISVTYPLSLPSGMFVLQIQVAGANGAVGPVASVTKGFVPPAIELLGVVYARWIGTPAHSGDRPDPVAGATVSTSLDSRTAVTDARGLFDLRTGVSTTSCFTITISAQGLPTYRAERRFGSDAIVAYTLGSTPQYPIPSPCS